MWPRPYGQISPPMFPSLNLESQGRTQPQSPPSTSRSHQALILGPLETTETETVYRCTCNEEEPISYREKEYSENGNRAEPEFDPSDRLKERFITIGKFSLGFMERVPVMSQPSASALLVASKVIKHARDINFPHEYKMYCPDCLKFPSMPVTGPCGHTRCTKCIERNGACPCGDPAPESPHLNILVRDLISKMLHTDSQKWRLSGCFEKTSTLPKPSTSTEGRLVYYYRGPDRIRRYSRRLHTSAVRRGATDLESASEYIGYSVQARYQYAKELLSQGRYREAAPQLAHVAATTDATGAKAAKNQLAQVITTLSATQDPRRITRELYRSVREQSATGWLKLSDLECVICCQVLQRPVTMPCGHTFCRQCIERNQIYRARCALCSCSLENFNVSLTGDDMFVSAAIAAVNSLIPPGDLDSDLILIFACTVAYPGIPCPLLLFNPRYRAMIQRILNSGSRKFGMVPLYQDRTYSNYGTILEVRDCVQFEDGRTILSTVGVSRFRIIERTVREGCEMARIEDVVDLITSDVNHWVQMTAPLVYFKAKMWLASLDRSLVADIEATFGLMPQYPIGREWSENTNGPEWLWWLIAILPLKSEIQGLMIASNNITKRMTAVSRTLDVMQHVGVMPDCEIVLTDFC